jgi:hypothetical protein
MHRKIVGLKKISFIIFVLILSMIGISVMNQEVSLEVGIIGSIITFIYGFFLSSMFKFVEDKYIKFSSNIGMLSSNIQSLYNLVLLANDNKLRLKVRGALVKFIESIKALKPDKYGQSQDVVNELFQIFKNFKIRTKNDTNIHSRILHCIMLISSDREEIEVFGHRYLTGELKLLFLSFPVILSMIILAVTMYNPYVLIVGIVLILVIILTSYLLLDMDNLSYGEYKMNKENLNSLLEFIQKH